MAVMHVQIITPDREVYSDEVDLLVAPGSEGQLGILPNHSPLMTSLQPGVVKIRKNGDEFRLLRICLDNGWARVIHFREPQNRFNSE